MQRKLPHGLKVYLPLVLMLVFFVFMLPRSPRFRYEYKKGEHWKYETLTADFAFPLLKTDDQLKEERNAHMYKTPYFKKVNAAKDSALARFDRMPMDGLSDGLKDTLRSTLVSVYAKGLFAVKDSMHYSDPDMTCMVFQGNDFKVESLPVAEIYTQDMARSHLVEVCKLAEVSAGDSVCKFYDFGSLIIPNLHYDNEKTQQMYEASIHHQSVTSGYMERGSLIVEHGGVISDQVLNRLDSYKAEFERSVGYSGSRWLMWSGIFIVAVVMVAMFFFALYFCEYNIFTQFNKYMYVLLLYVMFSSITFALAQEEVHMYYMIPYSLMAMFMMAFFRKGFVMVMYFITLLPLLIATSGTITVFFIHLLAGVVGIFVYQKLNKGWLQFVGSFITCLIMVTVWLGINFMFDNPWNPSTLFYIALGAGLSVAGYPLIYLFERLFMLVSSTKLVELSDTSNTLLRMLADKAPGTFHHSLQVMNLADAAARAIEADIPLVRAAALYHDIGKINNPQSFTENEAPGVKFHDGLGPKESAGYITGHVADGLALAEKYKLPKVLKDFIVTHHGTTSASYFLTKYLNDGGNPDDVAEFYYKGMKPQTKEQVILMLSDAVEAASRSLKDYSNESISKLVDRIIDGKANDGQLAEAEITLREISIIRDVMKTFLQQVYHSRIEYPKRKTPAQK